MRDESRTEAKERGLWLVRLFLYRLPLLRSWVSLNNKPSFPDLFNRISGSGCFRCYHLLVFLLFLATRTAPRRGPLVAILDVVHRPLLADL